VARRLYVAGVYGIGYNPVSCRVMTVYASTAGQLTLLMDRYLPNSTSGRSLSYKRSVGLHKYPSCVCKVACHF
jgi:hypothetical protein